MTKLKFPRERCHEEELFRRLDDAHGDDASWREGRTFSLVYNAGEEVMQVVRKAYVEFMIENALGPTTYPSLRRFEAEVVAMTADLLGGDEHTVGSMTSGGTESILMAVKTARDFASETKGVTGGRIVLPASAHPAFDKAAHYMGLEVVRAPVRPDLRADVDAVGEALTDDTIMVVGSAPGYPHGVVDPIEELSTLALERGLWFHTDACLGGFLLPFVRKLGHHIPTFDFSLPGVTSMSADVHKYGFAAKGASVVLYRGEEQRRHQFFVSADWSGGIYATPAIAGARSGGSIAAAWAVLNHLGEEGYLALARTMMDTTARLVDGVNGIDGLHVLSDPEMTVFAFGSDTLNVYALADQLQKRRWHVERQHLPPSLHLMVSPGHAAVVDEFLADLVVATDEIRGLDASRISHMAAMYGMMGTMPDRDAAHDLVLEVMAQLYKA